MKIDEGNYRITLDSGTVMMTNSDTRRLTIWRSRGEAFSLRTIHQVVVHRCVVGEPFLVSAQAYDDTVMPTGVVTLIEESYHPLHAPGVPELSGPISDVPRMNGDEADALLASLKAGMPLRWTY